MTPPNIVLVTCHDLGQHLGCYGWQSVPSPALDGIAGRGVLFENSFCTAPQCSPSRSALHTGRHAHTNGMLGLAHSPFNWRLHPDEQHIARRLQAAGYETALIGAQHLVAGDDAHSLGYDSVQSRGPAHETGAAAAAYLEIAAERHRPFYLEVGFFEPHRPYDYGGVDPDDSRGVNLPAYIPDTPEARAEFAHAQGAIGALDAAVGQIFVALQTHGLLDQTWFIFAADHGLAMPRAKCTCYDPGIEAALIMHWPTGGLTVGRRIGDLVSHIDVVPTMLEALGMDIPANLHGRSYWPLLQGQPYQPNREIFAEKTFHTAYEPMRCIRTATHKLIVNLDQDIAVNVPTDIQRSPIYMQMQDQITPHRPHLELYDLAADPAEMHNLSGQPEVAEVERDLRQRLLRWMETTDDPILRGPVASPYYHEALAMLRS
jgi:N-sulfoglucosamine sulfohydrolase